MADLYIDQFETKVYGLYAREQMQEVCLGRIPPLDGMVQYAIAQQEYADTEMASVLARQPPPQKPLNETEALENARDTLTRFNNYLGSLKGRPLDPRHFFRGMNPSAAVRQRLTKLSATLGYVVEQLTALGDPVRDGTWIQELTVAHQQLIALERQHRSLKVERADLTPEVAAARDAWLVVYSANKLLIRGFLAHLGKPELLPLIFDDLAETQRAPGVTPDAEPAPAEEEAEAEAEARAEAPARAAEPAEA